MKLGPAGLLWYDAEYYVLICRDCQYAIQKNAIQSHLLRHKIYRDERRSLLSAISELSIVNPDDVSIPLRGSPPIDGLSIVSGYRCMVPECGHLCASSKRMKSHQSEVHGLSKFSDLTNFARPVELQTFFRGNKLRYFEVISPRTTNTEVLSTNPPHDELVSTGGIGTQPSDEHKSRACEIDDSATVPLDLEAMRCFHHFTAKTASTLPSVDKNDDSGSYWELHFVRLALQHECLMYGLLALSVYHQTALSEPSAKDSMYNKRTVFYTAQFLRSRVGLRQDKRTGEDTIASGGKISCILRCIHWIHPELNILPPALDGSGFELLITAIREYGSPSKSLETNTQRHMQHAKENSSCTLSPGLDQALCRLHELPSRMANVLDKPANIEDVSFTLEAIAALVVCCETSFTSAGLESAWTPMATWLAKIPHGFYQLVAEHSPPALLVLAYWATFLVRRAEESGCWFLDGAANKMLRLIRTELAYSQRAHELQSLLP
ncbi:hypothetical protein BJX64DRAFT_297135 [Aspergillus heterothallicus]